MPRNNSNKGGEGFSVFPYESLGPAFVDFPRDYPGFYGGPSGVPIFYGFFPVSSLSAQGGIPSCPGNQQSDALCCVPATISSSRQHCTSFDFISKEGDTLLWYCLYCRLTGGCCHCQDVCLEDATVVWEVY